MHVSQEYIEENFIEPTIDIHNTIEEPEYLELT
jgi:hypothetical protein